MKNSKFLVLFLITALSVSAFAIFNPPNNALLKYYSAYLSLNLNRAMERAKIVYHFKDEPSFDKNQLEKELGIIKEDIDDANANIANIVTNMLDANKKSVDKYLKNIDRHFAQVYVDLKSIPEKFKKHEDIAPLLSDIYYQINKAENEDHKEIKRILKLKSLDEPVYVKVSP